MRNRGTSPIAICVYGHSLDPADGIITESTRQRVHRAVALQKRLTEHSTICVAAGFDPTVPAQKVAMKDQMRALAWSLQASDVNADTEALTFNTEGEMQVFIAQGAAIEYHVSSWWHVPRIALLRRRLLREPSVKIHYVPVWDLPTQRHFGVELCKLAVTFIFRSPAKRAAIGGVAKLFFKTSY